jgi:hypothetical protein
MLVEASIGFRFVGDLHNRYWTFYLVRNMTYHDGDIAGSRYHGSAESQRRIHEYQMVSGILQLLQMDLEQILEELHKTIYTGDARTPCFSAPCPCWEVTPMANFLPP